MPTFCIQFPDVEIQAIKDAETAEDALRLAIDDVRDGARRLGRPLERVMGQYGEAVVRPAPEDEIQRRRTRRFGLGRG